MRRTLLGLLLALLHFPLYAQSTVPEPAAGETNYVGTVVFAILFVALCAGFIWMVWRNDKAQKRKTENRRHPESGPTP